MNEPWLVVGLGNPGPGYAGNRHNVGFMVVDELARRAQASFSAPKGMRADVAESQISAGGLGAVGSDRTKLVLIRPRTFMNESGQAVGKLAAWYKSGAERIVAVHDELDIDFGQLRIKHGGGDNGHNGLKSIRKHMASGDFYRIRFGIGRPPGRQAAAEFVLQNFSASARMDLEIEVGRAADAIECLIQAGLAETQNRFNS